MVCENRPHRHKARMADVFYEAVQRIHDVYNDDASKIWEGCPNSAAVVCRFLQFKGAGCVWQSSSRQVSIFLLPNTAGVKIATMAANLLVKDYQVEMADYCSIDISPDAHVRHIFHRLGLTSSEDNPERTIYKARELHHAIRGSSMWRAGKLEGSTAIQRIRTARAVRCPAAALCARRWGCPPLPVTALFSHSGVLRCRGNDSLPSRHPQNFFTGISPARDEWRTLAASPSLSNARCGRTNSRRVATPYG